MKRFEKRMSIQEHKEIADRLAIACHHLDKIFFKYLQPKYGKSHPIAKRFMKLVCNNLNGVFLEIKNELEEEFMKETSDLSHKDFHEQHGYIYNNLDERYKSLNGGK